MSQASTLVAIEQMVTDIRDNFERVNSRLRPMVVEMLPRFISHYREDHTYSELVSVFWRCCIEMGFMRIGAPCVVTAELKDAHYASEVISKFLSRVRIMASNHNVVRRAADRKYESICKRELMREKAAGVLSRHARVMAVRCDFGYVKDANVSISDVYRALDTFLSLFYELRHLAGGVIWYAWCLEQGKEKGYHIHFSALFNGATHQRDMYWGNYFGRQWLICAGLDARYFNCNLCKDKYERRGRCGIGMIRRSDEEAVENCLTAISYLSSPEKEDQYLRMRPKGRRAFGCGQVSRPEPVVEQP